MLTRIQYACFFSHKTKTVGRLSDGPLPAHRALFCPSLDYCKKKSKVKASFYIAQYPVLGTVQSALHFTSLADLFTQTPSRLLWEASSLQLMREGCSYTYPPLSIVRYSFIQLSELEQYRVKKLARCLNTAAQDSNPGSRSQECEALPLSHCAKMVIPDDLDTLPLVYV